MNPWLSLPRRLYKDPLKGAPLSSIKEFHTQICILISETFVRERHLMWQKGLWTEIRRLNSGSDSTVMSHIDLDAPLGFIRLEFFICRMKSITHSVGVVLWFFPMLLFSYCFIYIAVFLTVVLVFTPKKPGHITFKQWTRLSHLHTFLTLCPELFLRMQYLDWIS